MNDRKPRVGVLALQGDFEAHRKALASAGAEVVEVRTPEELQSVDGLVIPGGESSTILKLLNETGLKEPLREFGERKPIFGTCAGAILLASRVSNPVQESLELMNIEVERNAYAGNSTAGSSRCSLRIPGFPVRLKRYSFALRLFGPLGKGLRCWQHITEIRFWSSRGGIWWRRFIRSWRGITGFTRCSLRK